MKIYNKADGTIITEGQFRKQFPNKSFPAKLTTDMVRQHNFEPVVDTPKPDYDPELEHIELTAGSVTDEGYVASWEVKEKPLTKGEKDAVKADKQKRKDEDQKIKDREKDIKDAKDELKVTDEDGKALSLVKLDSQIKSIRKILGV